MKSLPHLRKLPDFKESIFLEYINKFEEIDKIDSFVLLFYENGAINSFKELIFVIAFHHIANEINLKEDSNLDNSFIAKLFNTSEKEVDQFVKDNHDLILNFKP